MSTTPEPISAEQANDEVAAPWRAEGEHLAATYDTGNMVRGGEFVARIIDAAESLDHHPDIDLRYSTVHLTVTTHSAGRLTRLDVELARRISGIAADLGL